MELKNPHANCGDEVEYVHAKLDRKVFNYFFRHVLAGKDGTRQTLVCIFFQKLYEQCQSDGILPEWDPTNLERVANIVARLNFQPEPVITIRTDDKPELGPERPVRTRRTNPRPSKSSVKPAAGDSE